MEGVEMSTVPAGYFDSNHYLASTRFLLEGRLGNRLEGMERKRERAGEREGDGHATDQLPLTGLLHRHYVLCQDCQGTLRGGSR